MTKQLFLDEKHDLLNRLVVLQLVCIMNDNKGKLITCLPIWVVITLRSHTITDDVISSTVTIANTYGFVLCLFKVNSSVV